MAADAAEPAPRRVVIEADGGSRGNPGPAGYGAVLKDADTGAILGEDAATIGRATNNVAEYSGLIAGLRLAADLAPGAQVTVRMDSKLVIEQMSGTWRVKHPDMRPLHSEASRLAPPGTTYSWVPRAENAHADRLANEALDGTRSGVSVGAAAAAADDDDPHSLIEELQEDGAPAAPARGWGHRHGSATTLVVVRHGVTKHTAAKRFSGGLGGDNPPLSEEGRVQIRQTGEWLAPLVGKVEAIVASPVRRTRESADILAGIFDLPVAEEPGIAEMEFGAWDGLTFEEVRDRFPDDLDAWLGSLDIEAGGGDSFREVQVRVLAALHRLRTQYAGRTVLVVSHVTPIKTLVAHALDAPLEAVFRMELSPASVTVLSWFDDDRSSMRLYNGLPPERTPFASGVW
ncbi:bifunctional RNase H/acid phosphatase [Nocardioides sp. GXZ039]|uniref:bifunctional RNase H/acid phosphatase n=1 Tax=Nocardioides sp. GXZ039 TaxID=3136018 RepID=UPI0030F3BA18